MRTTRITHTPLTTLNLALAATLIGLAPGCSDDSNDSNPGATDGDTETDSDSDSTDGGSGGTTAGPMPTSSAGTTPGTTTGGSESTTVDTDGETDPTTGDATTDPTTGDETDTGDACMEYVYCDELLDGLEMLSFVTVVEPADGSSPMLELDLTAYYAWEVEHGKSTHAEPKPGAIIRIPAMNMSELCAAYGDEPMTKAQVEELSEALLDPTCQSQGIVPEAMAGHLGEIWTDLAPDDVVTDCDSNIFTMAVMFKFFGWYIDGPNVAKHLPNGQQSSWNKGWICGPFNPDNPVSPMLIEATSGILAVIAPDFADAIAELFNDDYVVDLPAFESAVDVHLEVLTAPGEEPTEEQIYGIGENWQMVVPVHTACVAPNMGDCN